MRLLQKVFLSNRDTKRILHTFNTLFTLESLCLSGNFYFIDFRSGLIWKKKIKTEPVFSSLVQDQRPMRQLHLQPLLVE